MTATVRRAFVGQVTYVDYAKGRLVCNGRVTLLNLSSEEERSRRPRKKQRKMSAGSFIDDGAMDDDDDDDEAEEDDEAEDGGGGGKEDGGAGKKRFRTTSVTLLLTDVNALPIRSPWLRYSCFGYGLFPEVLLPKAVYAIKECVVYRVRRIVGTAAGDDVSDEDAIVASTQQQQLLQKYYEWPMPKRAQLKAALRAQGVEAKVLFRKYTQKVHDEVNDARHMYRVMRPLVSGNTTWIIDRLYQMTSSVQRRNHAYYTLLSYYPEHAVRHLTDRDCDYLEFLCRARPFLMCFLDGIVPYLQAVDRDFVRGVSFLESPTQLHKLVWTWQQYDSAERRVACLDANAMTGTTHKRATKRIIAQYMTSSSNVPPDRRFVGRAADELNYGGRLERFSASWRLGDADTDDDDDDDDDKEPDAVDADDASSDDDDDDDEYRPDSESADVPVADAAAAEAPVVSAVPVVAEAPVAPSGKRRRAAAAAAGKKSKAGGNKKVLSDSAVREERRLCAIAVAAWDVCRRLQAQERGSPMVTRDELLTAVGIELYKLGVSRGAAAIEWKHIEMTMMDRRMPLLSYNSEGDAVVPTCTNDADVAVVDSTRALFSTFVPLTLVHTEGLYYATPLSAAIGQQRYQHALFVCRTAWSCEALLASGIESTRVLSLEQCASALLSAYKQSSSSSPPPPRYTLVFDAMHVVERREWTTTIERLLRPLSDSIADDGDGDEQRRRRARSAFERVVDAVVLVGDVWHPIPTPFVLLAQQCPWLVQKVVAQSHVVYSGGGGGGGVLPTSLVASFVGSHLLCSPKLAAFRVWIDRLLRQQLLQPSDGDGTLPESMRIDDADGGGGGGVRLMYSEIPEADAAQWIEDPRLSVDGAALVMCTSRQMRRRVMQRVRVLRRDADDPLWYEGMLVRDRDTGVVWRLRMLYNKLLSQSVSRFQSSVAAHITYIAPGDKNNASNKRVFRRDVFESAECLCLATAGEPLDIALAPVRTVYLLVDDSTTLRDVALAARYATHSVVLVVPDARAVANLLLFGCRLPHTDLEQRFERLHDSLRRMHIAVPLY